jgi:hypothetical protein
MRVPVGTRSACDEFVANAEYGRAFVIARPRCDGFGRPRGRSKHLFAADGLVIDNLWAGECEYVLDGLPSDLCSVCPNITKFGFHGILWRSLPRVLLAYGNYLTELYLSHNKQLINFPPDMAETFRALCVLDLAKCPKLPGVLRRKWNDSQSVSFLGRTLWVSYHSGLLEVDAYTERCEQQRRVGVILLSRRLFGGVPVDLRRAIVCLMMQQFREQL